jgi:hypothetical protein
MAHHYLTLASSLTATCDHCNGPARPTADALYQAYRQPAGFVFLCASCLPEHHDAYAATRVGPAVRTSRHRRSTW